MPRSRSWSIESMTRSWTCSCAANVPAWRSMASTSVVLPWSTWAMIATLRMSSRRAMGAVRRVGGELTHPRNPLGTLPYMRRVLLLVLVAATGAGNAHAATIKTVSNRADLVSGGDVLVRVTPAGAKVTLNGKNVTSQFAVRPNGQYLALLTGLKNGANKVFAYTTNRRRSARLTIYNHDIG